MVPMIRLLDRLPEEARTAFLQRDLTILNDLNRFSGREMLRWEGMSVPVLQTVNAVLKENHLAPKLLPGCEILERAKQGITVLL